MWNSTENPLLLTDCYKIDHRRQYPPGTTQVFSNWTARKSRVPGINHVVFFGLQAAVQKIHLGFEKFFDDPTAVLDYGKKLQKMGFDVPVQHVRDLADIGYLPIEVWALPEGTRVPIGVPSFVIFNTHPDFAWLTNYLETTLSANIWGPCTSATLAARLRDYVDEQHRLTGAPPELTNIACHDFSYRGMYGDEAAAMSGAAHLLSFDGTDTLPAPSWIAKNYYAGGFTASSVPATEHSVMCAGTKEGELETFRRLITEVYPTGVVSIVSDTWDLWNVLDNILPALKDEILARDGKVVIRPDSGSPVDIICGNPTMPQGTTERLGAYRALGRTFGWELNPVGYKTLNPKVGLVYGDAIDFDRTQQIYENLRNDGYVPEVILGVGSYTYQYVTRDTFGFAMKATACVVDGQVREIFKDPVTDSGEKRSAKGYLAVHRDGETGELKLLQGVSLDEVRRCAFNPVYVDGGLQLESFARIRDRVRGPW